MHPHNGIWVRLMSPSKYVQESVRICEEYISKLLSKGYHLPRRAENNFAIGLCPELDVSLVLGPDEEISP